MCCGFRFLEFIIILLSSWAAGIVTNTIFEVGSLEMSEGTVESNNSETTDTDYEAFFAGYTFAVALFFTIAMKIIMQCWKSKNLIKTIGRQEYMLRVGMIIKLTIMILTPVAISEMEKMELKKDNQLVTGAWLYGCELVSTYIDYTQESLKEESKGGKRVFVKNFADFTSAQMIAAQLFKVDEYYILGISLVASFGVASYLACQYGKDRSEYEAYVIWLGLVAGIVEGLAIKKAEFKTQDKIIGYGLLFLLTFILPAMKKKYKKLVVPPEYEFSYHKTQDAIQTPNLPHPYNAV